jgi:hypothetical protein
MIIFKILALVGLIRLLITVDKPLLCSGLCTLVCLVLGLVWTMGVQDRLLLALLIQTAIAFGFSSLYFWLLYRIREGFLWWVVVILGPVIVLALDIVLA